MASYHCSIKIIGRSDGRSAVAAAAYRAGDRLVSAETGVKHDYRRKGGVEFSRLMLPDDAPEWAADRGSLWAAVEAKESRSNSQLSREFVLAIPHELSPQEGRQLLLHWVQTELVDRGIAADVNMHDPDPGEHGNRNLHGHVMTTMRGFDPETSDGWSKNRNRDWNKTSLAKHWRKSWAEAQNAALKAAGSDARVDHRSLVDQRAAALEAGDDVLAEALDRPPEPEMGVAVSAVERRAQAAAERRGEPYEPVTRLGQQVAQSRGLRATLIAAVHRVRDALRDIALFSAPDPFESAKPALADDLEALETLSDPFSAAEEPPDDAGGGPSFEM